MSHQIIQKSEQEMKQFLLVNDVLAAVHQDLEPFSVERRPKPFEKKVVVRTSPSYLDHRTWELNIRHKNNYNFDTPHSSSEVTFHETTPAHFWDIYSGISEDRWVLDSLSIQTMTKNRVATATTELRIQPADYHDHGRVSTLLFQGYVGRLQCLTGCLDRAAELANGFEGATRGHQAFRVAETMRGQDREMKVYSDNNNGVDHPNIRAEVCSEFSTELFIRDILGETTVDGYNSLGVVVADHNQVLKQVLASVKSVEFYDRSNLMPEAIDEYFYQYNPCVNSTTDLRE